MERTSGRFHRNPHFGYILDDLIRTVEPLPKEIEDAFLAEAAEFYDEAMVKEDELYRRIMESQREFKEYCILKQLSG